MKLQSRSVRNPRSPYAKENGLGSARDSRGLPGRPQRWVHPLVAIRRRAKHPNAGRTIRRRSTFARNPDIESVAQAPSAHRSPSIAGLHWSSFCLKQSAPRSLGILEPIPLATMGLSEAPPRPPAGGNVFRCAPQGSAQTFLHAAQVELASDFTRACIAIVTSWQADAPDASSAIPQGKPRGLAGQSCNHSVSFGDRIGGRRRWPRDDGRNVGNEALSVVILCHSSAIGRHARAEGRVCPGARDYAGSIVRYPFVVSVAP